MLFSGHGEIYSKVRFDLEKSSPTLMILCYKLNELKENLKTKLHNTLRQQKGHKEAEKEPTWELESSLPNLGVVPVGHPEDGVVDPGQPGHPVHLLRRGRRVPVLQVVVDGVVEQNSILQVWEEHFK